MNITSVIGNSTYIARSSTTTIIPNSISGIFLDILQNPLFSTFAICAISSVTRNFLPSIGCLTSIIPNTLATVSNYVESDRNLQNQLIQELGTPIQFDKSIQGEVVKYDDHFFRIKQTPLRVGVIENTLINMINDITQVRRGVRAFEKSDKKLFKDQKTNKLYVGTRIYKFTPITELTSAQKSADIFLNRFLALAIPGTTDTNIGINEETGENSVLDIETIDFSLDGLVNALKKCEKLSDQPSDSSIVSNKTFKEVSDILKILKHHLNSEKYKKKIRFFLDQIKLHELNKQQLIKELSNQSSYQEQHIDAEASVNLFFDELNIKSLSKIFWEAQLTHLNTLIEIFETISNMKKWNAIQRSNTILYPKVLKEQARLLKRTNIKIINSGMPEEQFNPRQLETAQEFFSANSTQNEFTFSEIFNSKVKQTLPHGFLSPLKVLMIIIKQTDENVLF